MYFKSRTILVLLISISLLLATQSCASAIPPAFPTLVSSVTAKLDSTGVVTMELAATAEFLETASLKSYYATDLPTATATSTQVPLGIFALLFYPPLIVNYDHFSWTDKSNYGAQNFVVNFLQSTKYLSCYIGVQGPTDFNGPHTSEEVLLGKVTYTVLSFPESSSQEISKAYIGDASVMTEFGAPVFWVTASESEWELCKSQSEAILATLHFP